MTIAQRLNDVLAQIISEHKPGDRLLSEPKLASQLGVSRASLREAMRAFETQGLIHRRQGSGTYVLTPSPIIDSGLEILESIETLASRIGLDVSMGELQVIHRKPLPEEVTALELNENQQDVIYISRLILAEKKPVAYLVDILPEELLSIAGLEQDFHGSVLDLILKRGSPTLHSSRCEISPVTASSEVARAFGIQRGVVLLRFISWLYTDSGQVVDYSYSYFLPGYFKFHVVRRVGQ